MLLVLWRWLASGQILARLADLWRAERLAHILRSSGLFDRAWYGRDPAVRAWRLNLALHYILRGASEGRNPSAMFDGAAYLRRYPDAAMMGMNPLAHYVLYGRAAGRETFSAAPDAMVRTPLSDSAYRAWLGECDRMMPQRETIVPDGSINVVQEGCVLQEHERSCAVLFVAAGASLAADAIATFYDALLASPGADMIYGDEDSIDADGLRCLPWFKPDWDPDLALAGDLAGPAVLFTRTLLDRLGWDQFVLGEGDLAPLSLKAASLANRIVHVARIVAHRNVSVPYAARLRHVIFASPGPPPLVTIVIPTRDRARLLAKAADGVLRGTDYDAVELLIADNDSKEADTRRLLDRLSADPRVRVIGVAGAFNWSAMNNRAAASAAGQVLLLLNNDVEVLQPGWLREMVAQAMRPEIGAVGAKLLYPDRRVQHAGVVLGPAGLSRHVLRGSPGDAFGPYGELAYTRTVSAVTGACLAIRRDVFDKVGGLDEQLLVTNNDIDLCLKVRKAGYRVIMAPRAVLMHREAATRGQDTGLEKLERVRRERAALVRRWGSLVEEDPYLNRNLCILRDGLALEAPARLAADWLKNQAACMVERPSDISAI